MSGVSTLAVVKHTLTINGAVVHTLNGGHQGPAGITVAQAQALYDSAALAASQASQSAQQVAQDRIVADASAQLAQSFFNRIYLGVS